MGLKLFMPHDMLGEAGNAKYWLVDRTGITAVKLELNCSSRHMR
jgi:hypothetical protein